MQIRTLSICCLLLFRFWSLKSVSLFTCYYRRIHCRNCEAIHIITDFTVSTFFLSCAYQCCHVGFLHKDEVTLTGPGLFLGIEIGGYRHMFGGMYSCAKSKFTKKTWKTEEKNTLSWGVGVGVSSLNWKFFAPLPLGGVKISLNRSRSTQLTIKQISVIQAVNYILIVCNFRWKLRRCWYSRLPTVSDARLMSHWSFIEFWYFVEIVSNYTSATMV